MNERIQKLWEQSKTSGVHPKFGEYDKYSAEKFAELIVRECARELDERTVFVRGHRAGTWIKQHFGVE